MSKAIRLSLALALGLQSSGFAASTARLAPSSGGRAARSQPLNRFSPGLPKIAPAPALALPQITPPASLPHAAVEAAQNPERQRPALQRLAAEVPFETPQPSDMAGQRDYAGRSFDFKLGAKDGGAGSVDGGGSGHSGGAGGSGGDGPDDGGGPDYPHENVKFRGKDYPSVALRPNIPVEALIAQAIESQASGSGPKSLHIAIYEFKQTGVLKALRRAKEAGLEINIILDYSNVFPEAKQSDDGEEQYVPRRSQEVWALAREGFNVKVLRGLGEYGIMHNKFALFDVELADEGRAMAEFGSYNWSKYAEGYHYENANFTDDAKRIKKLKKYWDWLDSLAQPIVYDDDTGAIALKDPNHQWPKTVPPPPVELELDVDFHGTKLPSVVLSPNRNPGESIEDWLVRAIEATSRIEDPALRTIDMSIFAMRSTRIASALDAAKAAGTRIRFIMDESQAAMKSSGLYAQWLAARGFEVRTLSGPNGAHSDYPKAEKDHHKFAIFGGELVETGSPNYTKYAAIANFENGHFIKNRITAGAYQFAFNHMWGIAQPLPRPAAEPKLPTDEELIAEVEREPGPSAPQAPDKDPPAKVRAKTIEFNGRKYDQYAFRPDKPIAPSIVEAIGTLKKGDKIHLTLYEFNLPEILQALREARERGVKVELVVDYSHVYTTGDDHTGQRRKPSAEIQALIEENFDILILKGQKGGIQHNKYAVLETADGESMVIFGSYNWAKTAENNHFENILFSIEQARVRNFLNYFKYQRGLASPVDSKKFEEAVAGALVETEEAEAGSLGEAAGRESKFPPPPEDPATPIELNGEKFQLEYFSPRGSVMQTIIRAVMAARSSIEIAMFSFHSRDIADAMVKALEERRKKDPNFVGRLILDAGQAKLAKLDGVPIAEWFAERGWDVRLLAGPNPGRDPMFEKQHNKYIVIDGKVLMTGSFNYSNAAQNNNYENENVIDDENIVAGFVDRFERMWERGWPPSSAKPDAPKGKSPRIWDAS